MLLRHPETRPPDKRTDGPYPSQDGATALYIAASKEDLVAVRMLMMQEVVDVNLALKVRPRAPTARVPTAVPPPLLSASQRAGCRRLVGLKERGATAGGGRRTGPRPSTSPPGWATPP